MKEKIPGYLFGRRVPDNEEAFVKIIDVVSKNGGEIINPSSSLNSRIGSRIGLFKGHAVIPKEDLANMLKAKFAVGEISYAGFEEKIRFACLLDTMEIPILLLGKQIGNHWYFLRTTAGRAFSDKLCQDTDYDSLSDLAKKVTKFMKGLKNG